MAYEMILTETQGKVAVIRLNRPQALNALCDQLMTELGTALRGYDSDPAIAAIVITGSERAFAAGADIKEMKDRTYPAIYFDDFIGERWETVLEIQKPVIAAVAGFALGGGCELAMMCDLIIAADTAKFGQPEINLGIIPGAGGSQRLTRAVGKSKAMEMILTGRMMDAAEAERANLVCRVVPAAELLAEAVKIGEKIARPVRPLGRHGQGSGQRGLRRRPARGRAHRAPAVPQPVRHRGPEGGHGRPSPRSGSRPSATADTPCGDGPLPRDERRAAGTPAKGRSGRRSWIFRGPRLTSRAARH